MRVDDRRPERTVVTPGDDEEVDLEAKPLAGFILIRDPQRVRRRPCGFRYQATNDGRASPW